MRQIQIAICKQSFLSMWWSATSPRDIIPVPQARITGSHQLCLSSVLSASTAAQPVSLL